MNRTITRDQADDWGLPFETVTPDEAPDYPDHAVALHDTQVDSHRWASVNELVFRAPDDGHTYRTLYYRPLTEHQEHDRWNGARAVELIEVEAVPVTTTTWVPIGDKTPPVEGDTGSTPAPTVDPFTEAAIRRSAVLGAVAAIQALPQDYECDPGRGDAVKLLRRLADHHTTAEQPAGLTWEARAEHAVRLYARTAIELEDAQAENRRLRARVTELEQPTAAEESSADAARRYARRLHAVEQLAAGHPGYHAVTVKELLTAMGEADDEQPAAPPQAVTVAHVEAALREWLTDFDYDLHKATACGEDDGEDRYPGEAEAFFGCLLRAAANPSA
ncbi:hypothetical protein [Streptomyces omiyaensis]|uniref:hypothetical protein n=1 Tax=Streptomyces omiyaensis TaxID=68247 RepID=UPI0036FA322E